MRDVSRRVMKQRRILRDQRVGQGFAVARQRADAQPTTIQRNAAQFRNVSDVDESLRCLQPQRERRHEALATRDVARIFAAA